MLVVSFPLTIGFYSFLFVFCSLIVDLAKVRCVVFKHFIWIFLCLKVVFVQISSVMIRQCLHLIHETQFKFDFKIETNVARRKFAAAFFPPSPDYYLKFLVFSSLKSNGWIFFQSIGKYTNAKERWRKQYNRFLYLHRKIRMDLIEIKIDTSTYV